MDRVAGGRSVRDQTIFKQDTVEGVKMSESREHIKNWRHFNYIDIGVEWPQSLECSKLKFHIKQAINN